MANAQLVAEVDPVHQPTEERARQLVRQPARRVDELEQVATGAVLHDEIVLGGRHDGAAQAHDVGVAQPLVVLHLALEELLRPLVELLALDDLDRDRMPSTL